MALVGASEAFVVFKDAAERETEWSARVTAASAQDYTAAADETARNATAAGTLLTTVQVLSELTMVRKGVRYQFREDDPTLPTGDSGKLRGNKAVFRFTGSGRGFITSIPGRNNAVIDLVSGTNILIEDAGAVENFRDAFEAVALDINGNTVTVSSGYVND